MSKSKSKTQTTDDARIDAIRMPKSMTVLVNTADLSPEARAEVELIAAKRAHEQETKLRAMRGLRERKFSPPGTGDLTRFQRTDNAPVSDGKPGTAQPHDARVVGTSG